MKPNQLRKRPHKLFGSIFKRALLNQLFWPCQKITRSLGQSSGKRIIRLSVFLATTFRHIFVTNCRNNLGLPIPQNNHKTGTFRPSLASFKVRAFYSLKTSGQPLFETIFQIAFLTVLRLDFQTKFSSKKAPVSRGRRILAI